MDQRYVWEGNNEAYAEKNTLPTVKCAGGLLMLCGCFVSSGTGNLQSLEGNMDSLRYQEILCENLMLSVSKLKRGHYRMFQQDNDPIDTLKSTKARLYKISWRFYEPHRKSLVGLEEDSCST